MNWLLYRVQRCAAVLLTLVLVSGSSSVALASRETVSGGSQDRRQYRTVSVIDWALRSASGVGATGDPEEIYVARLSFHEFQEMLTMEEIRETAIARGLSVEYVQQIWQESGWKAIYAVEEEWHGNWFVVELRGGMNYVPQIAGFESDNPSFDSLRLFYVEGSLVGEEGFQKADRIAKGQHPWGELVNLERRNAPEYQMLVVTTDPSVVSQTNVPQKISDAVRYRH